MARTDSLTNYLTDVAEAIKEKKGDDTPINASTFDSEIINLPGRSPTAIEVNGTTTTKVVGDRTVHEGDFIQQDDIATVSSGPTTQVVSNYYMNTRSLYMGEDTYLTLGYGNSQDKPSYWTFTDKVSYARMIDRNPNLIAACIQETFPDEEISNVRFVSQSYNACYCSNCFDGVIESCQFKVASSGVDKFVLVYLYYKLVDGIPSVVSACCEDTMYNTSQPLRETHQVSATQAIAVECSSPGGASVPGWGAVIITLIGADQLSIAVQYTIYETDRYTWGGACGFYDKSRSRVPFIIYRTNTSSTSSSASQEFLTAYTLDDDNEIVFLGNFNVNRSTIPSRGCRYFASNMDEYGTFVISYASTHTNGGYVFSFKYDEESQTVTMLDSSGYTNLLGGVITAYMYNEKAFLIKLNAHNSRYINLSLSIILLDTKTNKLSTDYVKLTDVGSTSGYAGYAGGIYASYILATRKGDSLEFAYPEYSSSSGYVTGAMPVRLVNILNPTVSRATTEKCIGVAKETKQPGETIRIVQGPSPVVSEEAV